MSIESELIRSRMEETRSGLVEKLEILENRVSTAQAAVVDTVENVKETVQQTVATVKGSVRDTVETVKSTFDVTGHVERHPWLALGSAVAAGYAG